MRLSAQTVLAQYINSRKGDDVDDIANSILDDPKAFELLAEFLPTRASRGVAECPHAPHAVGADEAGYDAASNSARGAGAGASRELLLGSPRPALGAAGAQAGGGRAPRGRSLGGAGFGAARPAAQAPVAPVFRHPDATGGGPSAAAAPPGNHVAGVGGGGAAVATTANAFARGAGASAAGLPARSASSDVFK